RRPRMSASKRESSDAGYWIEPEVFSGAECDAILQALSHESRSRAGVRHLMSNPVVSNVARDPRMLAIAKCGVGATAIPFRATLFEKRPAIRTGSSRGTRTLLFRWNSKFDAPDW